MCHWLEPFFIEVEDQNIDKFKDPAMERTLLLSLKYYNLSALTKTYNSFSTSASFRSSLCSSSTTLPKWQRSISDYAIKTTARQRLELDKKAATFYTDITFHVAQNDQFKQMTEAVSLECISLESFKLTGY